jgi:gliding motility-associated-like protein
VSCVDISKILYSNIFIYLKHNRQTNYLNPFVALRRIVFIVMGLCPFLFMSLSQNVQISGIPNFYLRVDEVQTDRVRVTDVAGGQLGQFQSECKVLLIQMTGGTLNTPPDFKTLESRTRNSFNNTGSYEVLQVDQVTLINAAEAWIIFTDNVGQSYDAGEKIQLVKFIEGETVSTSGPVTARDWDGVIGGIVAIIGTDSVKLNHNIDVSARGFRGGAVPDENYTGGCRYGLSSTVKDTLYLLPAEINRSGNKGEGIITTAWPYTKGTGFALNGGGAGNGLYSGGGGGSNYYVAGDGGRQSPACNLAFPALGGWGGYSCRNIYDVDKIIMGGGGGSGSKLASSTPSKGGDGGGIAIILTGILAGNGNTIASNGENASSTTGSGGGGGAGGTIILDATNYSGSLTISVKGGRGGSTTDAVNCTGSGGGGSGGVIWYSGTSIPATFDITNGVSGSVAGSCSSVLGIPGTPGSGGATLNGLIAPLTGFLFNSVRGTDTICAGQIPNLLTASQPKGGDGTYIYSWEQSIDNINWATASGTKAMRSLQPPALTQTTYYRRVVTSNFVFDTSRVIQVYVYPVIGNNTITGNDSICYNTHAKSITGTTPAGGNGIYSYLWQYSTDQSAWSNGGTTNPHDPGILQQSRYYRRVVNSTPYCSNTSNTIRIAVLPSITNNTFSTPDTVICEAQGPGPLNAKIPGGGDGTYSYQWQNKSLSGNWTAIPGTNVQRYDPGTLTDTTLYRRIVYSGNGNACMDTSSVIKFVHVLPALSNNLLASASDRYCAGEVPALITGGQPGGGDEVYRYQWRIRTTGNWSNIPGAEDRDFLPVEPVEANTSFSRVITSGENNVCHDTSAALALMVVPHIINNLGVTDQTICQFNTPVSLSAPPASGGLGGITYQWIEWATGATEWTNASGTSNQASYSPGALTSSTLFARKAFSDICTDTSETVSITVYPAISNNSILGGPVQYTCFNTPVTLTGSTPQGGDGTTYAYQWEQSSDNSLWTPVSFGAGTDQHYNSSNLAARQYFRRTVYSSEQLLECTDASDVVEVRINPLPTGDVISDRDTLCAGETLYVKFNTSGNGPFNVTLDGISSQTKTGSSASPDSMAFIPASSGQYSMYSVEDDSGCFADFNGFTKTAQVVVYDVPVADAGSNDEVCSNTYSLKATRDISGSEGIWTGAGVVFSDATNPNGNVTADNYGLKVLTWTESNWHCTDAEEIEISFFEQPAAPDAGPDQVLEFTFTTQLQAVPTVVGSGKWTVISGTGEFNNDTLPDALVSELASAASLKWTVTNGVCPVVSDDMQILVNPLVITKGFTPNGDTKNDFFDLGAGSAEWIKIKIFNSAGVLVFESDNYQEGNLWDGNNMSGVELPEGTYFYLIDMKVTGKQQEVQFRSFVEILR